MVSAFADLDRRHIHVEALQQLAQHLAFGFDEPFMEFTFHAFEVLAREGSGSKRIDLSTQSFECLGRSCISAGRHTRDMKY